jgi:nudix-type nucleoside diphosphatase (YffH/AdpP family)
LSQPRIGLYNAAVSVPQILSIRSLYEGWTRLRLVRVRLKSGEVVDREVEDHGDAVAVLPYDPVRRTVMLVRILRTPALLRAGRATVLECPAGLLDEDDPAEAARREAVEEVGLALGNLEHVGRVWTLPGISAERVNLYLAPYSAADCVNPGGGIASEHEAIEVAELGLDLVWAMVERGELDDMKTLTLVLTLRLRHPELFGSDPR